MPQRENNNIILQVDETGAVLEIIHRYTKSWSLILQYDEDRLGLPPGRHAAGKTFKYRQAKGAIDTLRLDLAERGEATE